MIEKLSYEEHIFSFNLIYKFSGGTLNSKGRSIPGSLVLSISYFHSGHLRHENTARSCLSADGK